MPRCFEAFPGLSRGSRGSLSDPTTGLVRLFRLQGLALCGAELGSKVEKVPRGDQSQRAS